MNKLITRALCYTVLGALSGCMTTPEKAYLENQAKTQAVRNLTNMDMALACLDKQLIDYHVRSPIYITSIGIPNRAGDKVGLNSGDDMLKTSIGQLARSNVFRYVDLASLAMSQYGNNANESGSRPTDAGAIDAWLSFLGKYTNSTDFHLPGYTISGSISQLDGNTLSDQSGGSLGSDKIGNVGVNQDQMVSIVTVDMQIMNSSGREIINGLTTKNSLAIVKSGVGMDISGRVKTVGGYFNVSYDRSEGLHQGVRDLIELSSIELLGRLAKVPYQQCLGMQSITPAALTAAADSYDNMSNEQRITDIQTRLSRVYDSSSSSQSAFYQGAINGQLDGTTRDAIIQYQRQAGLIANGQINLELYRSLKNPPPAAIQTSARAETSAPVLNFQLEDGRILGAKVIFARNSKLVLGLKANQDSYAQCFLKNQDNQVYRIFPTLEQKSDHLQAGQVTFMPKSSHTQIVLDSPSSEEVGCIISSAPLAAGNRLPLSPLDASTVPNVSSLQQLLEDYQQAAGKEVLGLKVLRFDVQ